MLPVLSWEQLKKYWWSGLKDNPYTGPECPINRECCGTFFEAAGFRLFNCLTHHLYSGSIVLSLNQKILHKQFLHLLTSPQCSSCSIRKVFLLKETYHVHETLWRSKLMAGLSLKEPLFCSNHPGTVVPFAQSFKGKIRWALAYILGSGICDFAVGSGIGGFSSFFPLEI